MRTHIVMLNIVDMDNRERMTLERKYAEYCDKRKRSLILKDKDSRDLINKTISNKKGQSKAPLIVINQPQPNFKFKHNNYE